MDPDIRDLLEAWFGGEVSAERRAALLARLKDDAVFRREFSEELRMFGMLKAVQAPEPRWLRLNEELGVVESAGAEVSIERGILDSIRRLSGQWVPVWWRMAAVSCACASILVAGAWWFSPGRTGRVAGSDRGVAGDTALAVAVKVDGAMWAAGQGAGVQEGCIVRQGPVRLLAGKVVIAFFSGVVLNIEGPADLDLQSVENVFCRYGRLRTQVPPGAEGFTVKAPGSAVVDLGTEVGVNVEPGGRAKLMVFEGKAQVSVLSSNGVTLHSTVLGEMAAADVDPGSGRIRSMEANASNFAARSKIDVPALLLDNGYVQAVHDSRPWGYWRFETADGGQVPNEISGRPALHINGPIGLSAGAGGNRSIMFGPDAASQSLVMDELWVPPVKDGYAIELWLVSEAFTRCSLVSLLSEQNRYYSLVELTAVSRQLLHEPGAVRFLHRWPPSESGGMNIFSGRIYYPYRWHHVVAQRKGDYIELFVDGTQAGRTVLGGAEEPTPCRLLLGYLLKTSAPLISRSFVGWLDEFALYDHPLSAVEISRHAGLGRGRKPPSRTGGGI